ncbi:YhcN/YlaJ family sporulation lipoprotein [Bacillus piscicola]|uniref:YhcN/YlaJ family sporulation lipoprotein n=1 Tax=Bacillus piscicola TaxID=1632684 RepID=UPI001F0900FF|nr:YhcN/YlaJ family sporulation lipoprotein [Bacillus piscicola]
MKKAVVIGTAAILFIQGCSGIPNNTKEDLGAEYGPHHPMDYVSYTEEAETEKPKVNNFGYSRNYSNEVGLDKKLSMPDIIDHQKTAAGIGTLLVQAPEVDEASVLITNEYALVAFKPNKEHKKNAVKQVKMMTETAVPYYYETVVTDNPRMMEDIESFKSMDDQAKGGRSALRQTVKDMKNMTKQPKTKKDEVDSM